MASKPTPQGNGIVFDGKSGTVYGNVTLDESLTIDQGETLTIPQGATLTTNGKLTNNGTINVENGGKLTGEQGGGTVVYAPTITTESPLPYGTVGTAYSQTLKADNNPTEWQVPTGALPAGLTLDKTTGVISGTPTTAGTSTFTVTAANSAGSVSKEYTLNIKSVPVTAVTLDQNALTLVEGGTATLTAAVAPDNATNKALTWTSDNPCVTVTPDAQNSGKATLTAVTPGTANITATAADGSNQSATCAVTVEAKRFQLTLSAASLDFGTIVETAALPAAQTVTLTNTGNVAATVALPESGSYTVTAGTGFTDGQAALAPGGTATLTLQPKANLTAGTYNETITLTGSNGETVSLPCSFTVNPRTYTLSVTPAALAFGSAQAGYTQPAAQAVTVTNTGNQPLTLTQPTAANYLLGGLSRTALNPGETATFTVQPKAGLAAGSYNETFSVAGNGGALAAVNLTFTVTPAPTPAPTAAPTAAPTPAPTATPAPTPLEMHTLHFDTNGGLPLADVKFGLGAPVELWPYTPVRPGYLFQGWYSDQALTKAVGTVVLTKDTTIYAKWAVDPAAAAAQSGSGSGSGSGGKGGSTAKATPTPTPEPTEAPTPTPEPTTTPEPTDAPIPTVPPQEEEGEGSFPVVPVAAGIAILVVLGGGIFLFRRFRD